MRHGAWRTAPISRAASVAVRSTSTSRQRSPSDRSSLKRLKGGQEITRNLDSYRPWMSMELLYQFFARILVAYHAYPIAAPRAYTSLCFPNPRVTITLRHLHLPFWDSSKWQSPRFSQHLILALFPDYIGSSCVHQDLYRNDSQSLF